MAQTNKPRLPKKIRRPRRVESPAEARGARHPSFGDLTDGIRKYLSETSENPLRDAAALHGIITESAPSEIRAEAASLRERVTREASAAIAAKGKEPAGDVVARIIRSDESKAPASTPSATRAESIAEQVSGRQPLSPELDELLESVLNNPEEWMSAPNYQFNGARPADLVGTENEAKIVDLLRAVDRGLF